MLKKEIERVKSQVDPIIFESLKKDQINQFHDLSTYQVEVGGKRLRPFLLMLFFDLMEGVKSDRKKALRVAAAIEIFHNYSLLLDDIIDQGVLRRNKETSWKKFGLSATLCASSFYFSTILDLLKDVDEEIVDFFSKKTKKVMEGEIIDVLQERGDKKESYLKEKKYGEITFDDYYEMVQKKTASLFELACFSGTALARKDNYFETVVDFGYNLGVAFQIRDDILDIFGDEEKFGKEIGKDIRERKGGNIILLLAAKEKSLIGDLLNEKEMTRGKIAKVMSLIKETDSKREADLLLEKYLKKTEKLLDSFPKNKEVDHLRELVEYISKRDK